jgi:hypothetical protein
MIGSVSWECVKLSLGTQIQPQMHSESTMPGHNPWISPPTSQKYNKPRLPNAPRNQTLRTADGKLCSVGNKASNLIIYVSSNGGTFISYYGNSILYKIFATRQNFPFGNPVEIFLLHNTFSLWRKVLFRYQYTITTNFWQLPVPECWGRTPLHQAVKAGEPTCVKLLLHARALVDVRDEKGLTPLLLAGAGVSFEDDEGVTR